MPHIQELEPQDAACLIPLLRQVHDLHVIAHPDLYRAEPPDQDLAAFLQNWIARPEVTALIAGTVPNPSGYLIYEIETRPASVLRHAETRAMLHHICVEAAARREGIGQAMIGKMAETLRARRISNMVTTYAAFNSASAALMARAGFAPLTIVAAQRL